MNNKERLLASIKGIKTDFIPLSVYDFMLPESVESELVQSLCSKGLVLTEYACAYKTVNPNSEFKVDKYTQDGHSWQRNTIKTPLGDIYETYKEGWRQEHYIKSPKDYKIMECVIRDEVYVPDYEDLLAAQKRVGQNGLVFVDDGRRSPYQRMLVDFVGAETFCLDIADEVEELLSLYEVMFKRQKETYEIMAAGPGEIIKNTDNITGELIGSERFKKFHLPFYEMSHSIVKDSGKMLAVHLDGRLKCLRNEISLASFDIIESFAYPDEGDLDYKEGREVWKNKAMWISTPAKIYNSEKEMERFVEDVYTNTPDGSGVAIGVSEYFPEKDWNEKFSKLLGMLSEEGWR